MKCLALIVLLFAPVALAAPPVADDAMENARLEGMLERDETLLIVQTFRRHRGAVLPFVDQYLEGGLKLLEDGGTAEDARAMFATGLAFAECASVALDDRTILEYAGHFASWSPKEQQRFRAGQAAYRAARTIERDGGDLADADSKFRESFRLAEGLGDTWGMAMAAAGAARTSRALDRTTMSIKFSRDAIALYRQVALEDAEVRALLFVAEVLEERDQRRGGLPDLSRAWAVVKPRDGSNEIRRMVYDRYITALGEREMSTEIELIKLDAGYDGE